MTNEQIEFKLKLNLKNTNNCRNSNSIVDVVLTVEVVRVLLLIIDSLNLDCCVEEVVFATTEIGYCCQSFKGLA
jgi:hypothetical protein